MAEQYCSQMLDSFLKLVHHSKSSIPAFCVSHFTFSLVATLGNLLVIRALIKASTIPANVRKMFISLAFSDLAVGLLPQLMDAIIFAVVWKMASRGSIPLSNGFTRALLFYVSSRRCIFPECYFHCI